MIRCSLKALFTFTPGKGTYSKTCHIKRIQWYAAFGPSVHFRAGHVAWAMMLGGRVGTVSISVGADGYVNQVFGPRGKYSIQLLI